MSDLSPFLNQLFAQYHRREYLSSDPLEFPHRYLNPWDQEVVALVSALLAYGNVKQIRRSIEDLLVRMGSSPSDFVRKLENRKGQLHAQQRLDGFVHRFNRGADLFLLFTLVEKSWREHGSMGAHFLLGLKPEAPTIEDALDLWMGDWREQAGLAGRTASFSHLLSSPSGGSCCKRWCMFLRWMGRTDAQSAEQLDLGLWAQGSPLSKTFPSGRSLHENQLVIPLDTHTGRISQYLGLTTRKSLGWQAALEVTASLARCDSRDPVRYDFALARLGILDLCQRQYRAEICQNCQLLKVCHFATKASEREAALEKRRLKRENQGKCSIKRPRTC